MPSKVTQFALLHFPCNRLSPGIRLWINYNFCVNSRNQITVSRTKFFCCPFPFISTLVTFIFNWFPTASGNNHCLGTPTRDVLNLCPWQWSLIAGMLLIRELLVSCFSLFLRNGLHLPLWPKTFFGGFITCISLYYISQVALTTALMIANEITIV